MASDPTLAAYRKRLRNKRRHEGWLPVLGTWGARAAAVGLLLPLVDRVFLRWLDHGPAAWGPGIEGILLRVAIVLIGLLSLDVYGAVIRGREREILAIWPVDPAAVVRYELIRVALERIWLLPAFAVLLLPVGWTVGWHLWLVSGIVAAGAWSMGLTVSAMVFLLAVDVSENPRWAGLLDLVRGNNPRAQAAFIYAPGVVLLAAGAVVWFACAGVRQIQEGNPTGYAWLAVPLVLSVVAWLPVPTLARRSWFRASAVLADIDARYAAFRDKDEGLRVYLEWTVRGLPDAIRIYAMRDLRHGWRGRRTLIVGAWLFALAALAVGWTHDPAGPGRSAVIGGLGVWVVASLGVLLEADEPEFLRAWLPEGGGSAHLARAWVLLAWIQPCLWIGALAALLRHGPGPAAWVLLACAGNAALAVPVAMACGRLQQRGLAVYGPLAAVAGTALAAALGPV